MKNLIALSFALVSLNSFAQKLEAPMYGQAEFTITKIQPLCPKPAPGQMTCMAFGSKVTISATLGCMDKIVFHDVKTIPTKHGIELHSVSVVLVDPMSIRAMCYRANTVTKTIVVPEIDSSNVTLINSIIEHN